MKLDALNRSLNRNLFMLRKANEGEFAPVTPEQAKNAKVHKALIDIMNGDQPMPPNYNMKQILAAYGSMNKKLGIKADHMEGIKPELHDQYRSIINQSLPPEVSTATKTKDLSQVGQKAVTPTKPTEQYAGEARPNKSTSPALDIGGGKSVKEQTKTNDPRIGEAQKNVKQAIRTDEIETEKGRNIAPVGATGDATRFAGKNVTDAPLYNNQAQYLNAKQAKMERSDLDPSKQREVANQLTQQNQAALAGTKMQSRLDSIQQKQRRGVPLSQEEQEWHDNYQQGVLPEQNKVAEQQARKGTPVSVAEQTSNFLNTFVGKLNRGEISPQEFQSKISQLKHHTQNKIKELEGDNQHPNNARVAQMLGVHLNQMDEHINKANQMANPPSQAPRKQPDVISVSSSQNQAPKPFKRGNEPTPQQSPQQNIPTPEDVTSSKIEPSNPMAYKHPSQITSEALNRLRSKGVGPSLVGTGAPAAPAAYHNPQTPPNRAGNTQTVQSVQIKHPKFTPEEE